MEHLTDYLEQIQQRGIPGCVCVVYRNHQPVYRYAGGFADAEKNRTLTTDTLFWLYSLSKLTTCTAAMILVDRGLLGLDDPVSRYLPEYRHMAVHQNGEVFASTAPMTVRHLMSMQSGLNYDLTVPSLQKARRLAGERASLREVVRLLATEPLDFEPGTHFQYSLSHDVLGAVIEQASDQTLSVFFRDNIFSPLGMTDTGFSHTPERRAKMTDQFVYAPAEQRSLPSSSGNGFVLFDGYESGGAGLISSAEKYILLLDALADFGVGAGGKRLLSREAVEQMRADQLTGLSRRGFDVLGKQGYSYGLGVRTLVDRKKAGSSGPLGEFGWDGAAGAYGMIDPENGLSAVYLQQVLGCATAFDEFHPGIRNRAYALIGQGTYEYNTPQKNIIK